MSYFTWKETGLTSDCSSLGAMASRFEEAAKLMRRMNQDHYFDMVVALTFQVSQQSDLK